MAKEKTVHYRRPGNTVTICGQATRETLKTTTIKVKTTCLNCQRSIDAEGSR